MKINNLLWVFACVCMGQAVNAQTTKKISSDPAAQLRLLVQVPGLEMPTIKMPAKPDFSNRPVMPGYDIKKAIEDANKMCPLLNLKSTLLLTGERANDELVGLQWKTTNTFGSNSFDVERSLGDSLHFEKVNLVWAQGGKINEKYKLPDYNDFNEWSYYRIKMLLIDGTASYSNIAKVKGYDKFIFSLYPNPTSSGVQVMLSSTVPGIGRFSIIDGQGKTVRQYSSIVAEGLNRKDLDISRLPAGVYLITVVLPDKQTRLKKIIKYTN
jgi:hypothetical protein